MTDQQERADHRSTPRKNPVRSEAEKLIDQIRKETAERTRRARRS
jgi:hypothetical protein